MSLKSVGTVKDTTFVELVHPVTGDPLMVGDEAMKIEVYGPYSSHYKAISNQQSNMRLQKAQRTGGKTTLTAEQIQSSQLTTLVKCVKSWNVVVEEDSEKPEECNEANVRRVFEEYPWVREQVEATFDDTRAFLA